MRCKLPSEAGGDLSLVDAGGRIKHDLHDKVGVVMHDIKARSFLSLFWAAKTMLSWSA
jgi:hypothetical protein